MKMKLYLYSVHIWLYDISEEDKEFLGNDCKDRDKKLSTKDVNKANRATYVPYFYSKDGYAALGHSNVTHFNRMAARSVYHPRAFVDANSADFGPSLSRNHR